MKVLDLLEEIEEICDTSAGVPLTNKIMIDKLEMLEIAKEIRQALPDEIQQAQFIKNERQRILDEAKAEYELLIKDAEKQATILTEQHEITTRSKQRAFDISKAAEDYVKQLKMDTFEYIDKILFDFQEKMDIINGHYFGEMYTNLSKTFEGINSKLVENRNEIKELAYRTQVEED